MYKSYDCEHAREKKECTWERQLLIVRRIDGGSIEDQSIAVCGVLLRGGVGGERGDKLGVVGGGGGGERGGGGPAFVYSVLCTFSVLLVVSSFWVTTDALCVDSYHDVTVAIFQS